MYNLQTLSTSQEFQPSPSTYLDPKDCPALRIYHLSTWTHWERGAAFACRLNHPSSAPVHISGHCLTWLSICMYAHAHTCICTFIHTYNVYINIYIYIYLYTHMIMCLSMQVHLLHTVMRIFLAGSSGTAPRAKSRTPQNLAILAQPMALRLLQLQGMAKGLSPANRRLRRKGPPKGPKYFTEC